MAIWAPSAREAGSVAANYCKGGDKSHIEWPLHFVYPLESHLNGLTEEAVRDLWAGPKCPLLTQKWAAILARVVILDKPTRMICPCWGSPQARWKQLGVITVAVSGPEIPPPFQHPRRSGGEKVVVRVSIWTAL